MGRQSGKTQLAKDLKHLIEQAERAQELENFKKKAEELYKHTHINAKKSVEEKEKLEQENKRFQKLLEAIDTECEMMLHYKFYKNDDGLTYRRIRKWIEDGQA